MSGLQKTRRRVSDISGNAAAVQNDRAETFLKFLSNNAEDAFTRPWHRLERGMRLNRLRRFVEEESKRFQLSDDDQMNLFLMLTKSLDKKQLNSKSIVIQDTEQQKILEIKGLVFHKAADGRIIQQLNERKATTMRKRPASPSGAQD